ncbi:hypothetical protein BJF96_g5727 [Verticillium dahliae]|nr:hypothetical protein VdG2_01752 [Verticillium dahliae VDG2]PNH31050.1 hypothetical protein BJF96_g5727 [Verticillium dahliae]PNH55307.1 hypothetical protein VD0003_g2296 [Verticillium dahliae]
MKTSTVIRGLLLAACALVVTAGPIAPLGKPVCIACARHEERGTEKLARDKRNNGIAVGYPRARETHQVPQDSEHDLPTGKFDDHELKAEVQDDSSEKRSASEGV